MPTALEIVDATLYEILPFPLASVQPFGFLAQVQMSRWDIRCKSNRRRDDIPFPREPAQCARGRRLRPRRRGGERTMREGGGGKGCSELGTEIHYQREAGKWDSLGAIITKWTSLTRRLELSIKVSANPRRILAGSRGTKAAVLLSPLAWSRDGPRAEVAASAAEIESSAGPEWRWIICIFCIPRTTVAVPRALFPRRLRAARYAGKKTKRPNFPRRVSGRRKRKNVF